MQQQHRVPDVVAVTSALAAPALHATTERNKASAAIPFQPFHWNAANGTNYAVWKQ